MKSLFINSDTDKINIQTAKERARMDMQIFDLFTRAIQGPVVNQINDDNEYVIQVTSVESFDAGMFDADTVHFKVIKGHLNEEDAYDYVAVCATSSCSFDFNEETQTGTFIDLNYEFEAGKILSRD